MNCGSAGLHGSHRIRRGQAVVVVRMEIKIIGGKPFAHIADGLGHLSGTHDAQRIGQHDVADIELCQRFDHLVHVISAVAVTVRPVFEVNVEQKIVFERIVDRALDICKMLIKRLAQLLDAVLLAALGEKIEHLAAGADQPVHAARVIRKAQHFNALQVTMFCSPVMDARNGFFFAMRNACGGDLNTVDFQGLQQGARDADLFVGGKRNPLGLLPVPKGGIH